MYKEILIATDGSELANRALAHGLKLANEVKARVTIVTVTAPWSALDLAHEARLRKPDPIHQFEEMAAASAKVILDAAAQTSKVAGVGGGRRSDDLGTRPNAGYAIGWNGADVDVGEIFAFGIRMPGKVTHARAVNRRSIGEVAEGNPHRFNAVPHRQQPFHILVRDDDRHVLLSRSLLGRIGCQKSTFPFGRHGQCRLLFDSSACRLMSS